jgi:hypothetical protein
LGILTSQLSINGIALDRYRAINEYCAALAMNICDEGGIDITKKAIWQDKDIIIKGLKDGDLKNWIQEKERGKLTSLEVKSQPSRAEVYIDLV